MAENGSHKYTSLTDLLDTAQMKADPAIVLVDDDDHHHDYSNHGHASSSDDDDYSYIISNNNSSSIRDDDHDCSNDEDDEVKKTLSENDDDNNNRGTSVYREFDVGRTSFIPNTVILPPDSNIMASSSSGERTPADNQLLS